MTYRNDLDALEARHAALDTELARKTRELDEATRMLEDAKARAKLPVLDNIRIASPCRAEWADMVGNDRVRACGKCEKQVFNLSELTRAEAEALIAEKHGKLCARYYRRHDGTIILADCTIGKAAATKRKLIAAGTGAMLASGIGFALTRPRVHDLDTIDHIEVAPAEQTTGHVAGTVAREAPPPKPIVVAKPVVPEQEHWLMGDIAIDE